MLAVADAIAMVAGGCAPVGAEQVSVADALGRVLAADVASRVTQPPADVSAMDGYAVRSQDAATVPVALRLTGESAAGHGFTGSVGAGEAVRISTGAPVPHGADSIVIQEDTERDGETVHINAAPAPGRWIRRTGLDFEAGQVLLPVGRVLTARDVGLAAAMNVPWLSVRRKPRVALIATGDEVVMPGDPLGPDQILSSNSLALAAYVTALGGEPINLGIAADDEAALAAIAGGARGADLLVTTGGISVGDHDLVRRVLGDAGLDIGFYRVAMRPGKPLMFGTLGTVPVLGLPGNPVSVGVTAVLFVGTALRQMLGIAAGGHMQTAVLGRDVPANDHRQDYLRSELSAGDDGTLVATPFERQDSAMLALLARADCLVVRAPNAPAARRGERVEIVMLRGGIISV